MEDFVSGEYSVSLTSDRSFLRWTSGKWVVRLNMDGTDSIK
jgi:hypothetical protein